METSKTTLKAALHDWAATAGPSLGEHPSVEALVAYQEGELTDPPAVERLRDHLMLCADCAALLLDLADFGAPQAAEAPAALGAGDVDAAWAKLRPLVAANLLHMPAPLPPPRLPRRPPDRRTWALAAALLLAAGLAFWVATLRQQLRQPVIAEATLTLAADATRGESAVPTRPSSTGVLLELSYHGLPAGTHRVEILAEAAPPRIVWAGDVHHVPDEETSIALPAGMLPPGRYRIRLFRAAGPPVEHRVEFTAH